jgi:carboxyl-terminal processing protease
MRKLTATLALLLALLFVASAYAAEVPGAAPVKTDQPAAPAAPAGETPSTQPQPASPAVEPAAEEPPAAGAAPAKSAKDQQAELYQSYERLVRVMDIVESRYVQPVDSQQLFEGAIRGIMSSLDPYSTYIPADAYKEFMEETEQQFSGIGITIAVEKERIRVVTTLEGMPAFRAGVLPGDFILKVDGTAVEDIGPLDEIARRLRGNIGTSVEITFLRPASGKEFTVTLVREEIPITTLRGYSMDPKTSKWVFMLDPQAGIAYIRITKFAQNTAKELDDAYAALVGEGLKGLVIDLRYNPGGLLDTGVAVADRFLDEGLIVRTQGRAGIHSENFAKPNDTYKPELPLVLLVNEFTASASEVLGGALQDHKRAVLVGSRTFGKGSVQNVIDLDGEGAIKITVAYYYTPSGRLVHRLPNAKEWGLEPDVTQTLTPDDEAKLREKWGLMTPETPPALLGEGGVPIVDLQLSRALDILRGMLLSRQESPDAGK